MSIDSHTTRVGGGQGRPLSAQLFGRALTGIDTGSITLVLPSGERMVHLGARPGPDALLRLNRWRALARILLQGDLGFAEGYLRQDWDTADLTAVIELAARNSVRFEQKFTGLAPLRFLRRLWHLAKPNTRRGSRRNIAFHYDLGNEFYRCWLDRGMTYSSALYTSPEQELEAAQQAKIDRVAELLDLHGTESVVEIGCGWGSLAARLAPLCREFTGITLSREQLAYARQRLAQAGVADGVRLALVDYRDLQGRYDRIVSIEMLEAVGESYWPRYFRTLYERLKPGGWAVLQAITIDQARFAGYRRSADFIQRHIFPGGMLPTRQIIAEQATAAGLKVSSAEFFGQSYARTLAEWRRRFQAAWPQIESMGFAQRFRRLWNYYLCYCEAGFRAGTIDVGLYVFSRPDRG